MPVKIKYFTIPFGPKVVFTKSAMAIAPTKDDYNVTRTSTN